MKQKPEKVKDEIFFHFIAQSVCLAVTRTSGTLALITCLNTGLLLVYTGTCDFSSIFIYRTCHRGKTCPWIFNYWAVLSSFLRFFLGLSKGKKIIAWYFGCFTSRRLFKLRLILRWKPKFSPLKFTYKIIYLVTWLVIAFTLQAVGGNFLGNFFEYLRKIATINYGFGIKWKVYYYILLFW